MKSSFQLFASLTILLIAASLLSCKKQVSTDATRPLEQSFQAAEPETKTAIATVNNSLRAGNYVEASRALAPVTAKADLTPAQKQAIGLALQQMNQAITANPALDTKEMY